MSASDQQVESSSIPTDIVSPDFVAADEAVERPASAAEVRQPKVFGDELITKFNSCKTIRELKRSRLDAGEDVINICKYAFNEVNINHQWMVEWKPIRTLLALGEDKHDFFIEIQEVQNDDNHTLQ